MWSTTKSIAKNIKQKASTFDRRHDFFFFFLSFFSVRWYLNSNKSCTEILFYIDIDNGTRIDWNSPVPCPVRWSVQKAHLSSQDQNPHKVQTHLAANDETENRINSLVLTESHGSLQFPLADPAPGSHNVWHYIHFDQLFTRHLRLLVSSPKLTRFLLPIASGSSKFVRAVKISNSFVYLKELTATSVAKHEGALQVFFSFHLFLSFFFLFKHFLGRCTLRSAIAHRNRHPERAVWRTVMFGHFDNLHLTRTKFL